MKKNEKIENQKSNILPLAEVLCLNLHIAASRIIFTDGRTELKSY